MTNQPPAPQPPAQARQAVPTLLEDVRALHAATSELAAQWGHTPAAASASAVAVSGGEQP